MDIDAFEARLNGLMVEFADHYLEAVDLDPDSTEGAAERAGWLTKMLDAFGGVVGRLLSAETEYGSVIGAGENHPDWPETRECWSMLLTSNDAAEALRSFTQEQMELRRVAAEKAGLKYHHRDERLGSDH